NRALAPRQMIYQPYDHFEGFIRYQRAHADRTASLYYLRVGPTLQGCTPRHYFKLATDPARTVRGNGYYSERSARPHFAPFGRVPHSPVRIQLSGSWRLNVLPLPYSLQQLLVPPT